MSEHTPKTRTVREAYASYWEPRFGTQYHEKCLAEFDRWLAAEKAKWQAEMVADLRAKFGVTNRAADYLARKGSDDDR